MGKKGLDALIASSPENIQYLTDVPGLRGYAVLPYDKNLEPFLITGINKNDVIVDSGTWIKDIRFRGAVYYWHYDPKVKLTGVEKILKDNVDSAIMDEVVPSGDVITQASMKELSKGLQERGLDKSNLGIEERGTTITQFKKLKEFLPEANLVFADDAFAYARQVKTEDELKLFEEIVHINEDGWKAICETAKPGVTEGELLKTYKKSVVSYGPEGAGVNYLVYLTIGSSSFAHNGIGMNRSAKLKRGDLISFNGGLVYKNHPIHMGRTAVLGEPENPKVNKYFQAILEAEDVGLETLRPGVKASDIYTIMMETARKTIPHYQRHHTGHSLGLGPGYDTPNFLANDHTLLEKGMVFNIEPTAFVEFGFGTLRLEDTLVITNNGYKLFTTTSRDIWRL
jgi:Xaa-Pro aminopeptidase